MRRKVIAIAILATTCLSGCSWYSAWFSLFGSHYSDSGPSLSDKADHLGDRVGSYRGDRTSDTFIDSQ
jgi:hypothetical protein